MNALADLTIFQSRYSRHAVREKFQVASHDGPVIYNGVDTTRFRPAPGALPFRRPRVCTVSFSTNPRKGTWQLGELAERHPEVDFVLCGRFPALPAVGNLLQMGHLAPDALADVLRSCHVGLHLAENDPCPNVVLEALASGLPVLYRDSGGTPELVGEAGAPVTIEGFGPALRDVLAARPSLGHAARDRAVREFDARVILRRYLAAIDDALEGHRR